MSDGRLGRAGVRGPGCEAVRPLAFLEVGDVYLEGHCDPLPPASPLTHGGPLHAPRTHLRCLGVGKRVSSATAPGLPGYLIQTSEKLSLPLWEVEQWLRRCVPGSRWRPAHTEAYSYRVVLK